MKPTTAAQWKKDVEEPSTVKLPSGNSIKLLKPSMMSLIRKGVIPTHLYKVAMGQVDFTKPENMDPGSFKAVVDLLSIYVSTAAVEPKIVLKEPVPDGAIHIDLLGDDDLFFIFNSMDGARVTGEASPELRTFPDEPQGSHDRSSGKALQPTTVEPS